MHGVNDLKRIAPNRTLGDGGLFTDDHFQYYVGHVRYINIPKMAPRLSGQNCNFCKFLQVVFQFPKDTWIHRKRHQI